jgi:isoleucyl-tRNA synthetase
VHLLEWPEVPSVDADEANWQRLREYRMVVLNAIEPLRKSKEVGSGLEAEIWLAVPAEEHATAKSFPLEELFITSKVNLVEWPEGDDRSMLPSGVKLHFLMSIPKAAAGARPTENHKCGRCWRYLPEVNSDGELVSLSRCWSLRSISSPSGSSPGRWG